MPTSTKIYIPTARVNIDGRQMGVILNPTISTSTIAASVVRDKGLIALKIEGQTYIKVKMKPNMSFTSCYGVSKALHPVEMNPEIKEKFCRIFLADPEFHNNTPVSIEIGGDLYTTILEPDVLHIGTDSTFGWLVMGSILARTLYPNCQPGRMFTQVNK